MATAKRKTAKRMTAKKLCSKVIKISGTNSKGQLLKGHRWKKGGGGTIKVKPKR